MYKCPKGSSVSGEYEIGLKLESLGNLKTYDVKYLGTTSSEQINRELIYEKIKKVEARIEGIDHSGSHDSSSLDSVISYLTPSSVFSIISDYLVYIKSAFIVFLIIRR